MPFASFAVERRIFYSVTLQSPTHFKRARTRPLRGEAQIIIDSGAISVEGGRLLGKTGLKRWIRLK